MFSQKKKLCKSALMAAVAISVTAQGQSTVADDESLDEIIVTATKRETSLMETAVAVPLLFPPLVRSHWIIRGLKTC